ncbi:MAG: hypothetical protein M0T85_15635 [Dehalococcoidales bacterium]|nr:hypothetical protein [Dehalococcoidales bacterium]
MSVDYGRMVPVLVGRSLATQNDALTARVTALENEMAAIKTKLGV